MRSPVLRSIASKVLWTMAVFLAGFTAAAFLGGFGACERGVRHSCPPRTLLLLIGLGLAIALGVLGSAIYRPPPREPPRLPWEEGRR